MAGQRVGLAEGGLQLGPDLRLKRQLGVDSLELGLQARRLILVLARLFFGASLKLIVGAQAQDVSQDLFALVGRLDRELVGAALHQESRVDEGVVVHPEQIDNALFGLAYRRLGDWPPLAALLAGLPHLKL